MFCHSECQWPRAGGTLCSSSVPHGEHPAGVKSLAFAPMRLFWLVLLAFAGSTAQRAAPVGDSNAGPSDAPTQVNRTMLAVRAAMESGRIDLSTFEGPQISTNSRVRVNKTPTPLALFDPGWIVDKPAGPTDYITFAPGSLTPVDAVPVPQEGGGAETASPLGFESPSSGDSDRRRRLLTYPTLTPNAIWSRGNIYTQVNTDPNDTDAW